MTEMNFKHRRVVVVGLGRSGAACARFLIERGARVTINDCRQAAELGKLPGEMEQLGATLSLGGHPRDIFDTAELIVLSPGVPHDLPPIRQASETGIPVLGELELASRFVAEPIVAVTGTNGKTTTTALIGDMLRSSGLTAFVGGNIGTPLIQYVMEIRPVDRVVVEVSSFQLDTIRTFHPRVAVLLNISEDHLDRYDGMAGYCRSKARIFENQQPSDVAVFKGDDPAVREIAGRISSRKWVFNAGPSDGEGARDHDTHLEFNLSGEPVWRLDLARSPLVGRHNRENIAAAALAALAAGGNPDGIQKAVDSFQGLPHRLAPVATIGGVRYFNDSKATNVDGVLRALESFPEPVILIIGGRGKGTDFEPLTAMVRSRVKKLVIIGETAPIIETVLGDAPNGGSVRVESMAAAVEAAAAAAVPGDVVLLSPACASFDMFRDYAHRGQVFCDAVHGLQDN